MTESMKEIQAPNPERDFTVIIAGLESATDALSQATGLFTLFHFMGDGDLRVTVERRYADAVAAVNDVGTAGVALINKAFGEIIDARDQLIALKRCVLPKETTTRFRRRRDT